MYLVYKHTSPSGKSYIGITNDYTARNIHHQSCARNNATRACRLFHAAIRKYGWDNFLHEIMYDELTLDQANWREQQCINEHGSMAPSGYNLTSGGKVCTVSDDTRRLLSSQRAGSKRSPEAIASFIKTRTGYKHREETKQKLSVANKGKVLSAETKAKMSATRKGVAKPDGFGQLLSSITRGREGKPCTDEKRLSMSRQYIITDPAGNTHYITNLSAWCRDNGLNQSIMNKVAQGKYTHHKGWVCRYND